MSEGLRRDQILQAAERLLLDSLVNGFSFRSTVHSSPGNSCRRTREAGLFAR